MSDSLVQLNQDERGVARITLSDAQRFNALSSEMLAALQSALDAVARDEQVRVVVLAAEGRAFCAGHNLKDMAKHTELAYYQQLFAQCSRMMLSIQKLPVPVIARVQGIATAAGCQLVAQCDLAVASSEARFATSGIQYGLFCSTPSVPLVRNMPIKQSMEMLLTGEFIDAQTALHYGLLNRVAEPERLDAAVQELVAAIVSKPRTAIRMGKELVYRQREMGLESAYQLAGQTMATNMLDADAQEGAQAFLEKRKPGWS
ncbi:enoyl-CoA hydratase [Comamonas testosteroni]|uniref:Enoyl-CoA hydratase domain-containing protein 3, mitochondrial n=1 Tax=Comamonas testosteroni TaxID=285 RepID=A0A096GYA1_COMTE|nr:MULTISPECIES: enoyl-CoA hydratase [Comamonas]KGH30155.1 enoyl-CoA hydratase [Comamonas testosteroni]KOC19312.1 enoyl-CoA hydratase [Comamonas testosteroni]MPT11204.1 enoyl-CoA hydratase [Comamonas sp.]